MQDSRNRLRRMVVFYLFLKGGVNKSMMGMVQ